MDTIVTNDLEKNAIRDSQSRKATPSYDMQTSKPPEILSNNRRQAFRTAPDKGGSVPVALEWENGSAQCSLLDISTTGMGLVIQPSIAQQLDVPDWLRIMLSLPSCSTPLDLIGTIPYRRLLNKKFHYGVQFDWNRTDAFYRQEAAISAYVMKRQQLVIQGKKSTYIPINKFHAQFYRNTPLYFESGRDRYVLYKATDKSISEIRQSTGPLPPLYILQDDLVAAAQEVQKGFNQQLQQDIEHESTPAVKATLCNLFEHAVSAPQNKTLDTLQETMDILVGEFVRKSEALNALVSSPVGVYTPVVHSVNMAVLTLRFCLSCKLSIADTNRLGLCALVHDVGKIDLPSSILYPRRLLTEEEFEIFKSHTQKGHHIIQNESSLDAAAARGALEHHEKLDGSGYPFGKTEISFAGRLLAIIDAFEHLMNFHRPYRQAKKPFNALLQIKSEVDAGKFNKDIFERFCHSLT